MDLIETKDSLSKPSSQHSHINPQNNRVIITTRHRQIAHAATFLSINPEDLICNQQKQQLPRTYTPLERRRFIHSRLLSRSSQRGNSNDASAPKMCTLQMRGEGNLERSHHVMTSRQLETSQYLTQQPGLTSEEKLMSKYFKHISARASKSLDNRMSNSNKPVSSLHWLKESKKKHSFLEQLDKYETERKKKPTQDKRSWLQCLAQKCANKCITARSHLSNATARKYLMIGSMDKRAATIIHRHQKKRKEDYYEQIPLKPWDTFKEDYYCFL